VSGATHRFYSHQVSGWTIEGPDNGVLIGMDSTLKLLGDRIAQIRQSKTPCVLASRMVSRPAHDILTDGMEEVNVAINVGKTARACSPHEAYLDVTWSSMQTLHLQ
jgi:hypothetical protein